jgi:hypothetical protein
MVIDVVHGKRAPRSCCYWKYYTVFFNGIPRLNYGYKNSLCFLLVDNKKSERALGPIPRFNFDLEAKTALNYGIVKMQVTAVTCPATKLKQAIRPF